MGKNKIPIFFEIISWKDQKSNISKNRKKIFW